MAKPEQDAAVMRLRSQGLTQSEVGRRLGITQGRVSQIETRMRADVPRVDMEQLRQDMTEQLNRIRAAAEDIMNAPGAPVVKTLSGGGGEGSSIAVVTDPESGDVVRDQSARLDAMREIVRAQQRMSQLLGTDQPARVEQSGTMEIRVVGVDPEVLE